MAQRESIVCPACGNRLFYALEVRVLQKRLVDPKTGALMKRISSNVLPTEYEEHLLCESEQCLFVITKGNNDYHNYMHLFDKPNTSDLSVFKKAVYTIF
jgi:DNA-directed RNA polymerase subunit RPC12/RpoP